MIELPASWWVARRRVTENLTRQRLVVLWILTEIDKVDSIG
jgi:hypothetical protein